MVAFCGHILLVGLIYFTGDYMSKREIFMVEESGYRLNKKEQKMYEKAFVLSLYKALYEAGRITVEQLKYLENMNQLSW